MTWVETSLQSMAELDEISRVQRHIFSPLFVLIFLIYLARALAILCKLGWKYIDYCKKIKLIAILWTKAKLKNNGWDWATWKHWIPVCGPPLRTGCMDYPTNDHSQNSKNKMRSKYFTYGLSDRLLVWLKMLNITLCKCNRLGFRLRPKLSLHLAISFAMAILARGWGGWGCSVIILKLLLCQDWNFKYGRKNFPWLWIWDSFPCLSFTFFDCFFHLHVAEVFGKA